MRMNGWTAARVCGAAALTVWAALQLPSARAQEDYVGASSTVGYVDSAIPTNLFRLRVDAGFDDNTPDLAEFFYSQYRQQTFIPIAGSNPGSGKGSGSGSNGKGKPSFVNGGGEATVTQKNGQFLIYSPQANGLAAAETSIDYQDVSTYVEKTFGDNLSAFVELPVRFLEPQVNPDAAGFADMNAGFKWAFLHTEDQVATFQLRTYIPTGDASRGLGNNHVSLEPALLYYLKPTDLVRVEAEFRDWIPIGGTDFEGDIIRYGMGVSYQIWQCDDRWVRPVTEVVGWTVLGGKVTEPLGDGVFEVKNAAGETIVNLKVGVRFGFGASDLYVGYGRALTGDVWYKDILRAEYRFAF